METNKDNLRLSDFGDQDIRIIEPTQEAAQTFGIPYGCDLLGLTIEQVDALKVGKMLAYHGNEYEVFIVLRDEEDKDV